MEEYSWCVGIASLVRQAFVAQALVPRSSHKEEGAECQKLRHHSFYLRSIYLNTSGCREARTRLEPSKEAKVKIEGYVTLFHTKYFNHAISIILPFCFAKIKSAGQLHKSNVGSLGWQTAEAAGDHVGHSNEAAATFVLRRR